MASVYHDFSLRSDGWDHKENNMKEENTLLKNDLDDCKLSLKRTEEILESTADSGVAAEQYVKLGTSSDLLLCYAKYLRREKTL